MSVAYTQRLLEVHPVLSIGSIGGSYDSEHDRGYSWVAVCRLLRLTIRVFVVELSLGACRIHICESRLAARSYAGAL